MALRRRKPGRRTRASRLTTEETRMQQEAETVSAGEAQRRAEADSRERLDGALRSEAARTRVSRAQLSTRWRELMRLELEQDLKDRLVMMRETHKAEVERTGALIGVLRQDIRDAGEQFQVALQSHRHNVDALMNLQASRVRDLEDTHSTKQTDLLDEFREEREKMDSTHSSVVTELNSVARACEQEMALKKAVMREEFTQVRDDIKNKNQEEIHALRISLEGQIDELESHFEAAYRSYVMETESQTTTFKTLTLRDADNARKIEQQVRKLRRLQDMYHQWKLKLGAHVSDCQQRNRALAEEKESIAAHFQELKARMYVYRNSQRGRLAQLTKHSQSATKKLMERLQLAERILKLAEMNRKSETEEEKIMPFRRTVGEEALEQAPPEVRQEGPDAEILHSYALDQRGNVVSEWNSLDRFFGRHNRVLLDVMALELEEEALSEENEDLRALLKRYLDGVSLNQDVLDAANPLLVVNDRAELPLSVLTQQIRSRDRA